MKQAGIVAISDDGRPVMNARVMRRAMEFARSFDLPVIDHCEDLNLSAGGDMHEGVAVRAPRLCAAFPPPPKTSWWPAISCSPNSPARAITSPTSPPATPSPWWPSPRARGLPVTCEATPHHFALTDAECSPYDSNYKMKPPLRSACDVDAIIEGIVSGAIDAIATDHAPHAGSEKMQEFERCPFGIIGLETAIGLSLEHLVHTGKITLTRMVELFTTGPANVLKLDRGTLAAGAPGDVTIFDHRPRLDLRRQPVLLEEPQLPLRRTQPSAAARSPPS